MQPCISVFLLVRKPKKEKVDRRKRSSFPRCLLFSMKAQRARELAQSMCLMNGRRSFCIQRHSDDSLRIVRTCRTDSEGSGRHSHHQERPVLLRPARLMQVDSMVSFDQSFDSDVRTHDNNDRRGSVDPLWTSILKAEYCSA